MKIFPSLLLISTIVTSTAVFADDVPDPAIATLKTTLTTLMPDADITRITPSPINGLYEVIVGPQVVYMSPDAKYFVSGDLIELKTRRNYTEEAKSMLRLKQIDAFGEDKMVVYTPPGKVKHTVTVVTDVNCPYCRRLHSEMSEYMADGIKVRYLFMPLKGPDDFKKTISVWCADDRNKALDIAKSGGEVEAKTCDNPIMESYKLARSLGVNGTPAIILEDGEMLPGYVPVKKLVEQLDKS
jgi:thiol:disulfide interchange protein DsbC